MDYLKKIQESKTVEECALYIRAQGCRLVPMMRQVYSDVAAAKGVAEYENDAQTVENFTSIRDAKSFLKSKGYF